MSSGKKRVFPLFEKSDSSSNSAAKRAKGSSLTIYSWNVAGLRAVVKRPKKGDEDIAAFDADIVLLQETKCDEFPPEIGRLTEYPYKKLFPSKDKKGYSGVAFLAKEKPLKMTVGMGDKRFDGQGRYLHAEYEDFHVINVYVPNSGRGLVNLALRHEWEEQIRERLAELDKEKPVIYTGDMNVAHEEIDLKNPKANANKSAGFTDQERNDFTDLLGDNFVDVYRTLNPDKAGAYTYWSYFGNSRGKNVGWRLDYFVVSKRIMENVEECEIHSEMPIPLRVVEPVNVSLDRLNIEKTRDELQCVANGTLANLVRQLSSLSMHGEQMFNDMFEEMNKVNQKLDDIALRTARLYDKVHQTAGVVPQSGRLADNNLRKPYRSQNIIDQHTLSRQTMPRAMVELYDKCDPPPALYLFDEFRKDNKPALKYYTDPGYFFELWKQEILKECGIDRKIQKNRPQPNMQRPKQEANRRVVHNARTLLNHYSEGQGHNQNNLVQFPTEYQVPQINRHALHHAPNSMIRHPQMMRPTQPAPPLPDHFDDDPSHLHPCPRIDRSNNILMI
ncbi:unnamed protein product [Bursaphelenchus okinawaensis]|uniref:DNA-(apurinic or apyrimidinic site) endonuclease n=1 Tax=Bursaphelenchus okinawaensis TaxID=465554 RepID=A0A811JQA1_9BILA|nr:unnamed protein product [Bursaphelenchus okinawaensis]CAG9077850.1 unnamed protein product [Bursaphelenchus okinawaensis]